METRWNPQEKRKNGSEANRLKSRELEIYARARVRERESERENWRFLRQICVCENTCKLGDENSIHSLPSYYISKFNRKFLRLEEGRKPAVT